MNYDRNIPGFINKVNFVTNSWTDGCDLPIYVYIETALPVLRDAALAWFALDADQIAREALKPPGVRGRSHTSGKGKGRKFRTKNGTVPGRIAELVNDPNAFIGRRLYAVDALHTPVSRTATKFMFKVAAPYLLGLQYLFVAELVTGSIFNWTSLLQRAKQNDSKCQARVFTESPATTWVTGSAAQLIPGSVETKFSGTNLTLATVFVNGALRPVYRVLELPANIQIFLNAENNTSSEGDYRIQLFRRSGNAWGEVVGYWDSGKKGPGAAITPAINFKLPQTGDYGFNLQRLNTGATSMRINSCYVSFFSDPTFPN